MRRLLLSIALISTACGSGPKPTFRTEEVGRGDVAESVTATGEVQAIRTVNVGTQVSGTVERLYVDYNAEVHKGQLLAELDPRLFKAALARAEASLAAAKAEVDKAKALFLDASRTHERSRKLVERSLSAQAELDAALAQKEAAAAGLEAAKARVQLARAERDTARTNLALCRIRSPIDGIVLSRAIDVGQTVAASFQSPTLFTIAHDLTQMQILAHIDEADIGKVAPELPVRFSVEAFPGESFQGRVREVRAAPDTVQNVVTYTAVVDAPNPERRLRQGMTASVSVSIQRRESVLRLPNAALRYRPPEEMTPARTQERREPPHHENEIAVEGARKPRSGTVYKLVEGRPSPVEVTLGLSDGKATELLSGLAEGEAVVVGDSVSRGSGTGGPGGFGGPRRGPF